MPDEHNTPLGRGSKAGLILILLIVLIADAAPPELRKSPTGSGSLKGTTIIMPQSEQDGRDQTVHPGRLLTAQSVFPHAPSRLLMSLMREDCAFRQRKSTSAYAPPFARKVVSGDMWPKPRDARGLNFPGDGTVTLRAHETGLEVLVAASAPEQLEGLKGAVASHLDRFAFREAPLALDWG
jgi:hypothetical protein